MKKMIRQNMMCKGEICDKYAIDGMIFGFEFLLLFLLFYLFISLLLPRLQCCRASRKSMMHIFMGVNGMFNGGRIILKVT